MFTGCFGNEDVKVVVSRFRCLAIALLAVLSLVAVASTTAEATEGGGGAYPNGAEDFMSGAVPPPGTYFINYFDSVVSQRLVE